MTCARHESHTRVGTTTFAYRYLLLDAARAPGLEVIIQAAADLGLDVLQICENARPMELSGEAWSSLTRKAFQLNLELQLGCKTTRLEILRPWLERAVRLPSRTLRLVFEEEDEHTPPTRAQVDRFLADAYPLLERMNARLAIENHFDIPSRMLAEAVAPYPAERVGFCVDTANSLRNFEPPERVLELLGPRAFCYHLKDYAVEGDKLGFKVGGAPLGQGRLPLDWILDWIFEHNPYPELFVENWVPSTGDWEADVRADEVWLRMSLDALRNRLTNRA